LPSGGVFEDLPRVPNRWREAEAVPVHGHPWRNALSTASTFGARVAPLAADLTMMRLAMRTGGAWDHTTSLMLQGFMPYPIAALMQSFRDAAVARSWPHRAAVLATRLGLNAYQSARITTGAKRRLLVAPDPPLATHLETQYLAQGTDWQAVAADTRQWMDAANEDA
jgi:hypothetical protein